MIHDEIKSDRVVLFHVTPELLRLLVACGCGFDFSFEPGWLEKPEDLEEPAGHCDDDAWWLPFLIRSSDEDRVIGACLHKGPLDENRQGSPIRPVLAPSHSPDF